MVDDVRFEPGNMRRSGTRLPDEIEIVDAHPCGDEFGRGADLTAVEVAACFARACGLVRSYRNGMGGEYQSRVLAGLAG